MIDPFSGASAFIQLAGILERMDHSIRTSNIARPAQGDATSLKRLRLSLNTPLDPVRRTAIRQQLLWGERALHLLADRIQRVPAFPLAEGVFVEGASVSRQAVEDLIRGLSLSLRDVIPGEAGGSMTTLGEFLSHSSYEQAVSRPVLLTDIYLRFWRIGTQLSSASAGHDCGMQWRGLVALLRYCKRG